ncbi:tRNA uridine(34) 5-carboxymethylaminomethyl modification radical SAM/GNAT enzyme Elp3 [archaeon]|nr:tRNA uridine(34) 5-carboxymethylaminomethyl modification radical SAM/GNAT enzyme Elp3 [archaeon]
MEIEKFCKILAKQTIKQKIKTKEELIKLRDTLTKTHKPTKVPSLIQILLAAKEKDRQTLFKLIKIKPTREQSGVSVVAVMSKPFPCPHGRCTMCPGGGTVPQSYTGEEPAARRAIRNNYDAYLQVFNRLEQYILIGHYPEKIELIVMGGTFPSFPINYQNKFIKDAFAAMNDFGKLFTKEKKINFKKFFNFFELDAKNEKNRYEKINKKILKIKKLNKHSLKQAQLKNEKANIRCIALVIETRPDYCKQPHINRMLKQGCTRVELGVQSVYPEVLKKIKRGHTLQDSIQATKLMKNAGLKVGYHIMPGAPGSSPKKDLEMFKILFKNKDFKPDALKIYPCMVMPNTELLKDYKAGKFKPLTTQKAAELIAKIMEYIPEYSRVMRIQRDIPSFMTHAGVNKTNLRQDVDKLLKSKKIPQRDIRARQIRNEIIKNPKLKRIDYEASQGKEIFLSIEEDNKLIAFLRLRLTKEKAIVRELHVYSNTAKIGETHKKSQQHKGFGKQLLKEAEKISKPYKKLIVISGIGVKEYYRTLDYKKQGVYMVKQL